MTDTIPKWMLDAATELSTLDEVSATCLEDWHFDLDSETATLPEGDEDRAYGWSFSQHVRTLACTSGRASVTVYPEGRRGLADEALRCVRAVEAFWA